MTSFLLPVSIASSAQPLRRQIARCFLAPSARRTILGAIAFLILPGTGCSPAVDSSGPDASELQQPAAALTDDGRSSTANTLTTEPNSPLAGQSPVSQSSSAPRTNSDQPGTSWSAPAQPMQASPNSPSGLPLVDQRSDRSRPTNQAASPQLRADLTPTELSAFLGEVDREMRSLINGQSGITDRQAIQSEVQRVVELKRTASQRLMNDPQSDESEQALGRRGYLQAMSHLASMGDLPSAEKLQAFAEEFRNDSNPELRSDSRLVLIGFAIESLRHGKQNAADRVLKLMQDVAASDQPVDVATLMVMGQAKDTLLQYEHVDEATAIRDLIIERFAGSGDPEVAKMAAMIAASGFSELAPELQRLEKLRMAIVDPDATQATVTPQQWGEAVDAVLNDSVDLLTVQFLAGMSLECEAIGRDDIADATYDRLAATLVDRQDAIGREARTALQAKRNREAVIGQLIDPDLPSVTGQRIAMADFRGRVVLMPFWSGAFPDSLAVLPNLLDIQSKHPEEVAVVGMNLDLVGTEVRGFMEQNGLEFPSFRSESDPSADITNEVAYRFGAVSLLFVAIIDQSGRVVSVEFSGEDLSEEVEKLIR